MLTRNATLDNLHERPRTHGIWYAWGVVIVLALGALAARLLNFSMLAGEYHGAEWVAEVLWWQVLIPMASPAFATVGALVISRRPGNRIGWLMLGLGALVALQDIFWQYAIRALVLEPGSLPIGKVVGILTNISGPPVVMVIALILLLFPTSEPVSSRWRIAFWLTVAMLLLNTVSGLFVTYAGITVGATVPNPLAIGPLMPVADVVHGWIQFFTPVPLLLAVMSIVLRWRGSRGVERQQMKWIAYVGALLGISLVIGIGAVLVAGYSYVMIVPFTVAIGAFTIGMPAAIGAAVLRYRLLDIDIVINRTLVYSAVTIILGGGFTGIVIGLQILLERLIGGQDLAIIVATLATVAAVRPVRDRTQQWVDRQFYRRTYDTATMLARLGRSVREEVDLERLETIISDTICETMQPSVLSIWVTESAFASARSSGWRSRATGRHEETQQRIERIIHERNEDDIMLTWIGDAQRGWRSSGGWRRWIRRERAVDDAEAIEAAAPAPDVERFEINQFDPLLAYLELNPRVTPIERIPISSPALDELRSAGITVIVPLVNQGKLLGTINLGPRMSGQGYSSDDLTLLENLASQSAAALRVAQLVRQQQAELQERERIDQQLRLARDIQKTLLPKSIPDLPGWRLAAYYQPAWEVGGDFYDFIHFPDGRLGVIIGDVTDKGVASALVMATTRSILRAAAERERAPGAVLRHANNALVDDIPANMFVTCFYLLLDPETGIVRYANAGHDLPYRRGADGVNELRATGMPLGLLPDMPYDEYETTIALGETLVFYSDGLVEAHDQSGDMFGFPRLQRLLGEVSADGVALIRVMLDELTEFAGPGWRQEDDVTIVTVGRIDDEASDAGSLDGEERPTYYPDEQTLVQFNVPSAPGNERGAIEHVVAAISHLDLPAEQVNRLRTAVGEAVMNGMEHGNRYHEDLPVHVAVVLRPKRLIVRITDAGTGAPLDAAQQPDLEAKLAGEEPPRGWGLFLIRSMVDEMNLRPGVSSHTTELVFYLE